MNDTNFTVSSNGTTFNYHTSAESIVIRPNYSAYLAVWLVFFLVLFLFRRRKTKKGELWLLVMALAPMLFFVFAHVCIIFKVLVSN